MQSTISLVGIALFIVAAYGDVKSFRIPNLLVAAVALLGVARLLVIGDPNFAFHTVVASFTLLAIGFVMFWLRHVGGGDVKLITAAALLVGYNHLLVFLLFMSICGLLLSVATLVIHRYLPLYAGPSLTVLLPKGRLAVPYGVAIAASGSVILLLVQTPLVTSFIG